MQRKMPVSDEPRLKGVRTKAILQRLMLKMTEVIALPPLTHP